MATNNLPDLWNPGTVHLKSVDKEGRATYSEHQCWNMDRFVSACMVAALQAKGTAEQVTQEDYRQATGYYQRKGRR